MPSELLGLVSPQTYTYITGVPSGTTLTLQTSPGTTGTNVTYSIGGGWANFFTNTTATAAWLVPANRVYILGSGTPNPASYTYDYTLAAVLTMAAGSNAGGCITFENDPATPGYKAPPDTTGGMPVIKVTSVNGFTLNWGRLEGLYFVAGANSAQVGSTVGGVVNSGAFGCVLDQLTFTSTTLASNFNFTIGCEAFCSTGTTGGTTYVCIGGNGTIYGNNFHDLNGGGLNTNTGGIIANNIIAKCLLDGIKFTTGANSPIIINNTIDGNLLNGIEVTLVAELQNWLVMNNIISNHTVAGKYGINIGAGTIGPNTAASIISDYNVYYNNTINLNGISYGPHDTHGGSNPYVGQSTENYTLA